MATVITAMDTMGVAGGVHPVITRHIGVDGMAAQDPMAFTEIISMSTIMFM
jgi:hypothetical protein